MSHSRSAPPLPSGASTAWKLPPLRERLERARQPGASVSDVDLLVAGLAPDAVTEAMTPRERADLLLDILGDKSLSRREDHQGRQVRHVAARALLALGYPYALELPPGAMPPTEHAPRPSTAVARPPAAPSKPLTRGRLLGGLLALGANAAEWTLLLRAYAAATPNVPSSYDTFVAPRGWMFMYPVMGVLALGTVLQGGALLLAMGLRRTGPLRASAWTQWVGGMVRGWMGALLWYIRGKTLLLLYATGFVLLTSGALMGLAGFCLWPWEDDVPPENDEDRGP